ncbi:MAG: DUF6316 family protein [Pseudomonadales bacterium]|nr:DUF6316 family protein [Pseudomonadales bacterium]
MTDETSMLLNRLDGRLFVEKGRLFYVLHVDRKTGIARVSVREDDKQTVVELPVHEIGAKVGACNHLMLDGLESLETARRVRQEAVGWYFTAREGKFGPFASEAQAQAELKHYIISVQGADVEYEGRFAKVG